jgi:hypothetical protein
LGSLLLLLPHVTRTGSRLQIPKRQDASCSHARLAQAVMAACALHNVMLDVHDSLNRLEVAVNLSLCVGVRVGQLNGLNVSSGVGIGLVA